MNIGGMGFRAPARGQRWKFLAGLTTVAVMGAAALLGVRSFAPASLTTRLDASSDISFNTGTGVAFTIDSGGDMTSLTHNGVQLFSPQAKAGGEFESGLGADTVTSRMFDGGRVILITATQAARGLTQYYVARKGDNKIYMDTKMTEPLPEGRFILRLSTQLLPNAPVASNTAAGVGLVEGGDVFKMPGGRTASKFYSSVRLIAQNPYGISGHGSGVYFMPGTNEMSSGGPFFRDIQINTATSVTTNVTHYMYSGHEQTQGQRFGLQNPYAVAVTNGGAPVNQRRWNFLSAYIPGLLPNAQRGTVAGTVHGSLHGLQAGTVALDGPTGQFWGAVLSGPKASVGRYTIVGVRPGTYTVTLYAGELAIGATKTVTVTARKTAMVNMTGNPPAPGTLFQLGTFDGTPRGFRNSARDTSMHPSDVRMANWNVGTVNVAAGPQAFPMAQFRGVNDSLAVRFHLSRVPAQGAKLRIATTESFTSGRPTISVGNWNSNTSESPAPRKIDSRGVTRGTWRGLNELYVFLIPANVLKVGTNIVALHVISGSGGTGFLGPNYVFDALALDPA